MKYLAPQISILVQFGGLAKSFRELHRYLRGWNTETGLPDLS